MLPALDQMIVSVELTIYDALEVINKNAQGICFVVDGRELVGILTDGDIRRQLLSGVTLEKPIQEAMRTEFISLPVDTPNKIIQEKLSQTIRHIPLVDDAKRILDYACLHRYRRLPVMEPLLDGNELAYVTDCIQTNWISSQGKYVREFESLFVNQFDVPETLAICNGTAALHLALEALGIGRGDEVIVPDFTFAASINSIIYTGATPVLVDVTLDTWTIDIEAIRNAITAKTKAIMPVHIYGHPCDMDAIIDLAQEHNLYVISDAAEALGSEYKKRPIACFGDAVVFSFFGNKTITTGEGGIAIFQNPEVAERARVLRDHGMSKQKRYWHELIGYNYRMTNLQAAIGVAQMERLSMFVEKKRQISNHYSEIFADLHQFERPPEAEWATNSFWLYTMLYEETAGITRDALIQMLLKNGVETRPTFFPLHQMPPYQQYSKEGRFANSEKLSSCGISFPSSISVTKIEIERIRRVLHSIFSARHMANGKH